MSKLPAIKPSSRTALIPLVLIVLAVSLASNALLSKSPAAIPQLTTYSQLVNWVKGGGRQTAELPLLYEVVFKPGQRAVTVTAVKKNGPTATLHYPSDQAALELQDELAKDAPSVLYD